jgi:hypothetical protein
LSKRINEFGLFFKDKIRINMIIPSFRGNKGEDLEIFLKEYMKACIGTGLVLL